jgi:ribosomal-protein-serine acetyltransferase
MKSRALPKRLGFTEEGIIREAEWLYDHYEDHVVYGLLKKEYTGREIDALHSTTI